MNVGDVTSTTILVQSEESNGVCSQKTQIYTKLFTQFQASQHLPKGTDNSSRNAWMSGPCTSHLNTDPWGAVIVKVCFLFIILGPEIATLISREARGLCICPDSLWSQPDLESIPPGEPASFFLLPSFYALLPTLHTLPDPI